MAPSTRTVATFGRHLAAGVRMLLVLTLACGVAYPLLVTVAALAMPGQSQGSLLSAPDETVVGSSLIGQKFDGPGWFHARPAVGDYAGDASGGSNLGMSADEQRTAIEQRRAAEKAENPDATGDVPADALTASFSGLDPHISPEYATWQAPRVAKARGLSLDRVRALIAEYTQGRTLGFIGQPRVNVVELNAALAAAAGPARAAGTTPAPGAAPQG